MKVFLSWSGKKSLGAAELFKDWLPQVIQTVNVFLSTDDISKGAGWLAELNRALESASLGVILLTRDNIGSPWLHFEAGAIANSIGKGRVCPILVDLEPYDVFGPISQFQFTLPNQEEFLKLVRSINYSLGESAISDVKLIRSFHAFWPELESGLVALRASPTSLKELSSITISDALSTIVTSINKIETHSIRGPHMSRLRSGISDFSTRDALANMSYELRGALTVLQGCLELLQEIQITDQKEIERIYSLMASQTMVMQEQVGLIWAMHGSQE